MPSRGSAIAAGFALPCTTPRERWYTAMCGLNLRCINANEVNILQAEPCCYQEKSLLIGYLMNM